MRLILALLLAIAALVYWGEQRKRPIEPPPGQLVASSPQQATREAGRITVGNYTLTPRADFDITARILARERYSSGREADLSPIDLALGWGPMSDSAVLDKIRISQSGRFYFWQTEDMPIPRTQIEHNSANMHMIPASEAIESQLLDLREGQVIRLEGRLVDVDAPDGWRWRTSLTREDTGAGACEVVWVERVSVQ